MAKKPTSLLKPDDYKWTRADFIDWDVFHNNHLLDFDKNLINNTLTIEQTELVERNKLLLEYPEAWRQHVNKFEEKYHGIRDNFEIRFDQVTFNHSLECRGRNFPCDVSFNQAKFLLQTDFDESEFKGTVSFNNAEFGILNTGFCVGFSHAVFNKNASFDLIKCYINILFGEVVFKGKVELNILAGNCFVSFDRSKIEKDFSLSNYSTLQYFSVKNLSVNGNLFINVRAKSAVFTHLSVEGTTNFSGSKFETVPDFRDSKLDRPPEVAGMIVPPPDMVYKTKDDLGEKVRYWSFKLAIDQHDVAKYRKLKAMALAANDHEKDGEFFGYEMMAKRGHETTGFFPLLLNSLYWLLSFYGQSIARPCWALLISFFSFWVSGLVMIKYMTGSLQEFWFAGVHSALNTMPLIGTLFRTTTVPEGHISWYDDTYHQLVDNGLSPDWWAAISAGQQIIGAVLFFLLFLGLRNKFRLK